MRFASHGENAMGGPVVRRTFLKVGEADLGKVKSSELNI
jgi:hypothetical protein